MARRGPATLVFPEYTLATYLQHGEAARMAVDIQSLRRNTKRFRENPSELGWRQVRDSSVGSPQRANGAAASSGSNDLCFPVLEQVWWRRIVFDEFHELEAKQLGVLRKVGPFSLTSQAKRFLPRLFCWVLVSTVPRLMDRKLVLPLALSC